MSNIESLNRNFSSIGEELDARVDQAKESGDQALAGTLEGVRYKITSLGLSAYGTKYVDESNGSHRVLGQFRPSNGEIGLASYDVMENVGIRTGHTTEAVYGMVIEHELLHQQIHENEESHAIKVLLSQTFDADKVHMAEEGVVSYATSQAIDAYGQERALVDEMAAKIGTTRGVFCRIITHGEAGKLADLKAANDPSYDEVPKAA